MAAWHPQEGARVFTDTSRQIPVSTRIPHLQMPRSVPVTRRIVLAILATTVAALVLAGLGTLVLSAAGARREAQAELRSDARDLADGLAEVVATDRPVTQVRPVLLRALQK